MAGANDGPSGRSPTDEVAANEANLAGFLRLQQGMTGSAVRSASEATWVANANPFFWFNMIAAVRLSESSVPDFLAGVKAAHEELGTDVMLWLSPGTAPVSLAARLDAAGIPRVGSTPGMTADLDAVTAPPTPPGVTVERVGDPDALEAFLQALCEGFGVTDALDLWREFFLLAGLSPDGPVQSFLARVEGRPASVGTAFLADGVAGIYCVATVPAARRRGLGAIVTRAALDEARIRGCRTGVLQSSRQGFGVYAQMGFRHSFDYGIHRWSPPAKTDG